MNARFVSPNHPHRGTPPRSADPRTAARRLAAFAALACLSALAGAPGADDASTARPAEEVTFTTSDSVTVHADLYLATDAMDAPVILLFHQAGGDARGEYGPIVPRLVARGWDVLAVDQRVGGDRFGGVNRTVAALGDRAFGYCDAYPDLEAALAYVEARGLTGRRVAWGSSYSAALALRLAADHGKELAAVLAFSPASGEPLKDCTPESRAGAIRIPALVMRPASEMENDKVRTQLATFRMLGLKTYVADPGVHGSSMLVADRAGGDVAPAWDTVLGFLDGVLAPDSTAAGAKE